MKQNHFAETCDFD